MMAEKAPLIVLAAGGTGGHVFPAEALAAELMARGARLALVTDKRGGSYGGTLGGLETFRVSAGGIAGKGVLKRLKSVAELGAGALQARLLLARLRPAAVVGFGGYASVPTMMAATWGGLKTAVHEQNAVLGRANRLLAPRVTRVATSFERTREIPRAAAAKQVVTGMPVRADFLIAREQPYPALTPDGPVRLLITGGSQGARVLSRIVPEALTRLEDGLRGRLLVTQQCREEDLDDVKLVYEKAGIKADLHTFFADVPRRLADAHLFIGRAGASTLAEVTAVGRPAILIPYMHAVDDHQTANAHALDEAGGGWLINETALTKGGLADRIEDLFSMPATLENAALAAKLAGRPEAAARLADVVLEMIADGGSSNGGGKRDLPGSAEETRRAAA